MEEKSKSQIIIEHAKETVVDISIKGKYEDLRDIPTYNVGVNGERESSLHKEQVIAKIIKGDTSVVDFSVFEGALHFKLRFDMDNMKSYRTFRGKKVELLEFENYVAIKNVGISCKEHSEYPLCIFDNVKDLEKDGWRIISKKENIPGFKIYIAHTDTKSFQERDLLLSGGLISIHLNEDVDSAAFFEKHQLEMIGEFSFTNLFTVKLSSGGDIFQAIDELSNCHEVIMAEPIFHSCQMGVR